ncbi:condensation domain-containing protein [Micromonospora carbonacea]|uniref:condensation domain-containing protein n=1 Tax=Micromonospora carbonacea TaxID=47853 RepID=UPI003D75CE1A
MVDGGDEPQSGHNFAALLRRRAAGSPAEPAYTFLRDGIDEAHTISYRELHDTACALAVRLGQFPPGARALLLYPHGPEFIRAFWACLIAGIVPVPCYPPRNNRSVDRLLAIARDAQASVVLTHRTVLSRVGDGLVALAPCLVTDEIVGDAAGAPAPAAVRPADPAFLQYTSGSTGTPKGVVVSHGNLHSNQQLIQAAFGQDSASTIVSWLPFYHDMGLIGNVLHAVHVGAHAVFLSPVEFLRRPVTWLEAISRYRATGSGGPNFGYQHCADRITDDDVAGLDLSSWRVAYCGAELVRAPTLWSFADRFAAAGFRPEAFRPCYGMAEATLLVAAAQGPVTRAPDPRGGGAEHDRTPAPPGDPVVSCGVPHGFRCLVVDDEGVECPDGVVGEVWLSGASVAGGYWNNPEASEAFRAVTRAGEGPFYRTGDLGFLRAGELHVTGRIKELVIIRGRNHYPYDLEWAIAEGAPGVVRDGCVVFSVDRDRGEELVVQCEYDRACGLPHAEVIQSVQTVLLEEFGIAAAEVHLFAARHLPRTSSGKLQRALCRSTFLAGRTSGIAHWRAASGGPAGGTGGEHGPFPAATETERQIMRAVEHLRGPVRMGRDDTFFSAGFDSLGMAELAAVLSDESGRAVSVELLFECPTIPGLAARLDALPYVDPPPAGPEEPVSTGPLPMSSIQESIWIDHQSRAPDSRYNIPIRIGFPPEVPRERIEKSLAAELDRAELLHCQIVWRDGSPRLLRCDDEALRLDALDLSRAGTEQAAAELDACARALVQKPFDLDECPLFRATLARLPDGTHTLILVAHHIVCDGFSLNALAQRLLSACAASDGVARTEQRDTSYRSYVRRQRDLLARGGADAGAYWRERLTDLVPLRLPRDRRPPGDGVRGRIATSWLHLTDEQSRSLARVARRCGTTPFAVALTGFATVVGRITRRSDVVVGVPLLDRDLPAMKDTFGPCVNPVPLRVHLPGNQSGVDRVSAVGGSLSEALARRALPVREVAVELTAGRGDGRVPLTSVYFNGLTFAPREQIVEGFLGDQGLTARLDLDVYAILDGDGGGSLRWDYDSSLFEPETVRLWMAGFEACLRRLDQQPDGSLDAEPLLVPPRLGRAHPNGPADAPRPLVAMVRDTMTRNPQRMAVVTPRGGTTFGELFAWSRRVSGYLRRTAPEGPIGLYFHHGDTPLAISAMVGVLHAGRRYVVLEPRDPATRLRRIVSDAGVRVALANGAVTWTEQDDAEQDDADGPGSARPRIVRIAEIEAEELRDAVAEPQSGYLLYTSGTSGTPKGVIQDADNVRYFVEQYRRRLSITEQDTLSLVSSLGFDAAVLDVYTALVTGAQLQVLALHDNDTHRDLWQWVIDQSVTVLHATPSLYRKLISTRSGSDSGRLRAVVLGGEPVLPVDAIRHFEMFPDVELYNLYGQAESTLNSLRRIDAGQAARTMTLGVPCDGASLVLRVGHGGDPEVYEVGEIVVESPHVAKGYLGLPDLTADRFEATGYRTGDAGRFLPSGEIELVGRVDRQVKVNGYRVEPAEIESLLMGHPAVARARVLKHQGGDGGESLTAYVEVPDERQRAALDPADLRGLSVRNLPGYLVPSAIHVLDAFPLTPNNKLDTDRLPPPGGFAPPGQGSARPMNAQERTVAECMAGVLGVAPAGPASSFFELGGNSISVIELLHRLEKTTGLVLSFKDVFEAPTVAAIAAQLASAPAPTWPALARGPARTEYPLTSSQTRIWVQSQRTSYNVLASIHVVGGLEPRRLERAIDAVVARHEILRTRFARRGDEVVQRVVPAPASEVLVEPLDPSADQEQALAEMERRELHRDFDLAGGPLFQVTYVTGASPYDVLMLSMHHIVCDAVSVAIFTEEVLRAYRTRRESLPRPAIQHGDYALWVRDLGERGLLDASRAYWAAKLADGVPVLKLRTDRQRRPVRSFTGAVFHGVVDEALTARARDLCRTENVTLFTLLHCVLVLTLYNRTGQTDLCLGTLTTGREFSRHLEPQIGFLANTLALRTAFSPDTSFRELLVTARREFLESHAHQLYPLEQLADAVPRQEPGHSFLFDVLLVLHDWGDLEERVLRETGVQVGLRDRTECVAKFDLTFNFVSRRGRVQAMVEYDPELYDAGSVGLLWRRFAALLAEVVSAPGRQLRDYSGKVEEEQQVTAVREIELDL